MSSSRHRASRYEDRSPPGIPSAGREQVALVGLAPLVALVVVLSMTRSRFGRRAQLEGIEKIVCYRHQFSRYIYQHTPLSTSTSHLSSLDPNRLTHTTYHLTTHLPTTNTTIKMFRSTIARVSRPMATRGYADKCASASLSFLSQLSRVELIRIHVVIPYMQPSPRPSVTL
jgi:hypothetical protein